MTVTACCRKVLTTIRGFKNFLNLLSCRQARLPKSGWSKGEKPFIIKVDGLFNITLPRVNLISIDGFHVGFSKSHIHSQRDPDG